MNIDDGLMGEWLKLCGVALYEGFADEADVASQFEVSPSGMGWILAAIYNRDGYEGSALVVYVKDGKLYETTGSHCSCNGLEGQWREEETSVAALRKRTYPGRSWNDPDNYQSQEELRWIALLDLLEAMENNNDNGSDERAGVRTFPA